MDTKTKRRHNYRLARDNRPFLVGILSGDGTVVPRSHLKAQGFDLFKSTVDDMWRVRALSKAAGGNGSQEVPPTAEIREDTSLIWTDAKDVIDPPYDFDLLYQLTNVNIAHATAISTKAGDFAYNGWFLEERPEVRSSGISEKEVEQAREEVEHWLSYCVEGNLPIEDLVKDVAWDREALGSAGFEVIRDVNGVIRSFNHIPFHTMRVTSHLTVGNRDLPWYVHSRFKKEARYFAAFNSTVEFGGKGKPVRFDPARAPVADFPRLGDRQNFIRRKRPFMSRFHDKEKTRLLGNSATEFYMLARPPKTDSTVYGQPAASSAYACMLGQLKSDLYNLEYFNAKGVPQYAIIMHNASSSGWNQTDSVDSEAEAMEMIKEYFQKHLKAADRSTLVISCRKDSDVKFERLSPESIDASFMDYEKRCDERIRVAHETPPAAMGIIQTANLGSGRESAQMARYRDHIVSPGQRVFSAAVNEQIRSALLIPYFRFKFLPMPVDDEASRRQFKLDELKQGAIPVNEYRRETGRIPFTTTEQGKDFADALILPTAQVTIIMPSGEMITTKPGDEPRIGPAPNPKVPNLQSARSTEGGKEDEENA